jgi:hypothetical protein
VIQITTSKDTRNSESARRLLHVGASSRRSVLTSLTYNNLAKHRSHRRERGAGVTPQGGIAVLSLQNLPNVFYLGD